MKGQMIGGGTMSNNYWAQRMAKAQDIVSRKSAKEIEKQMRKYYKRLATKVIEDYEATYNKLLATVAEGQKPTPADLYKLDKYWQMQGALRQELNKLGERQVSLLTKRFELNYFETYYSLNIKGLDAFTTIDKGMVKQLINSIWCADGKSWSQRIWKNTELLAQTLNDELLHCVVTGKKTTSLKKLLQDRFNVSYNNADMLVRTELTHIATQAAQQRYRDYGIEQMEVWVDEDEKTCPICAKHEGEIYSVNDKMPVPFHPRCRCCMVPVVKYAQDKKYDVMCQQCGKTFTSHNEKATYCPDCKAEHRKAYERR